MSRVLFLASILCTAACASTSPKLVSPAAEASAPHGSLEAGTAVCIAEIVGVRYALEDILAGADLEPADSCMSADVRLEETGEPSAWVMRYQRVGDAKWLECKSDLQEREQFARECVGQMRSDLGGS
jgi:hypothetical protein